jgi:immunity protein Imm5 of predicted polymorphic toxin system
MSTTILEIAKAELERLNQDTVRCFDWRKRREIYKLLNVDSETTSNSRHKFLAIQSAEFVLPLFRPIYPDDSLVFELFKGAKAFSENRVDNFEKLDEIEDKGYHASQWFGDNFENEQREYQSAYAGFAAYKSLVEVRHMIDPWKYVNNMSKGNNVMRFGSTDHSGWVSGQDFTDEEWNHLAALGDTSAAASFAYSTTSTSDRCRPKLLYEFWKWWTEVALPKALTY